MLGFTWKSPTGVGWDGMWGLWAWQCPPLLPAAEIPKSSSFPPRAGGSLLEVTVLEGLVNHFGWPVQGRGLWPPATPGRGLGPREGTQSLTATPGLRPRTQTEPLGQLTTSPTGQSAN